MNPTKLLLSTTLSLAVFALGCAQEMNAAHLQCEHLIDPIGLGEPVPRLSWWDLSSRRGQSQTAYQILVASTPDKLAKDQADLWDSGKVTSDQSNLIDYGGSPLRSRQQAFWKVRVWDKDGKASGFSKTAKWEEGLLDPGDWQAHWIGMPNADLTDPDPSPYCRKQFALDRPIKQARIFASAQGLYKLYLNGRQVNDSMFDPGFTDYDHRVLYQAYDVTRFLRTGENAIGMVVGDGWYVGHVGGWDRQQYGKEPYGLAQLEIEYTDGSQKVVASGDDWSVTTGPILASDFMRGENYDARKELPNWDVPGYNDSGWQKAISLPIGDTPPIASCSQPVRQWNTLRPKNVSEPKPDEYVFDMGQNMVGFAELKVRGQTGQTVKLRFAEMLNPDGTIYTANLRTATSTDTYTLKGKGTEVYRPSFTFHGFRYVEVTGYPGRPNLDSITGIVVGSDIPNAGSFSCSDPMVNQLWHNIYWSQRGNYLSVPTDCPQRDERLGWMGDAEVFIRTATYNSDVSAFMTKWLNDVQDGQSPTGDFGDVSPRVHHFATNPGAPAWGDAGVIVPYTLYQVYDDKRVLERHYEAMKRWVDYVGRLNPGLIWVNNRGIDYSDWLNIDSETPHEVIATAYFAHSADLLARSAGVLGKSEDEEKYRQLYEDICRAFDSAFVSSDGRIKGDTQTAYLLALQFHLIPESQRDAAIRYLTDDIVNKRNTHLSTGFLGVSFLNPVLSSTGNNDLAYKLLLTDTFPSWGYPIKNGATTIWERWDGWTKEKGFQNPGMNSFNHYSLGSVGQWLYADMGGINLLPGHPGYKEFVIHPRLGPGINWVNCSFDSIYGHIVSNWKKDGTGVFMEVEIPANSSAEVYVPASSSGDVSEGGKPASQQPGIGFVRMEDGAAVFEVGSGSYRFSSAHA